MKEFYRTVCKGCGRNVKTKKLKKMGIQSQEKNIPFEIEIELDNVIQNNYSQKFVTPEGHQGVLDLKDLALNLTCPFCNENHEYSLRSLVLTDRLD